MVPGGEFLVKMLICGPPPMGSWLAEVKTWYQESTFRRGDGGRGQNGFPRWAFDVTDGYFWAISDSIGSFGKKMGSSMDHLGHTGGRLRSNGRYQGQQGTNWGSSGHRGSSQAARVEVKWAQVMPRLRRVELKWAKDNPK